MLILKILEIYSWICCVVGLIALLVGLIALALNLICYFYQSCVGFNTFRKFLRKYHGEIIEENKTQEENKLLKHRLEVANTHIESRVDNMIPEHYDDLKYILNECDLKSTW